jgi:peptidoglycan hydrolase-like protein with peptidoglycan-binding domain
MTDQIQPWPLLKQGSRGHPVPALQYLLRARGHLLTVDGIFGPKTEAAVEGFQTTDQIRVDGIVGPLTWRALVSGMLSS